MPRTAGRPVVSTTIARVACAFDPRRRDEQSCSSRAGSSARRGGVRERCRSQLHILNRVRREALGQTREGSDRVSTTRPQQSHSASPHPGLTTCRAEQRRGEHGSQQCERCVSRPCLPIVKASRGVWPPLPSADGDALTAVPFTANSRRTQPFADQTRSCRYKRFSSARSAVLDRAGGSRAVRASWSPCSPCLAIAAAEARRRRRPTHRPLHMCSPLVVQRRGEPRDSRSSAAPRARRRLCSRGARLLVAAAKDEVLGECAAPSLRR